MSTPTEKALAVDRLAKAADSNVVPVQDYLFGLLPKPEFIRPDRNENETPEVYRARIDAARLAYCEANPNVFGITHWDEAKLGTRPTEEQIEAEIATPSSPIQAAWDASAAAFESLPLGKQALWEPVRVKVADFILKGDFAAAATTIATVPTLYDGMETDRAMFLALFAQ